MRHKGVTLIELLFSAAVIVLLAVITFGVFSNFKKSNDLYSATESGLAMLGEARSKTLSSLNSSQYGVYFASDRVVFFVGTSYATSSPGNNEVILSSNIEISSILLNGGGSIVVYKRLTGETDEYGAITLRLKSDTTQTRTIIILASGSIQ